MADETKAIIDGGAGFITIASLAEILPAVTALFGLVWYSLRIYETDTVQRWLGR